MRRKQQHPEFDIHRFGQHRFDPFRHALLNKSTAAYALINADHLRIQLMGFTEKVQSIYLRHIPIRQQDVDMLFPHDLKSLRPWYGRKDLEALGIQDVRHDNCYIRIIVNQFKILACAVFSSSQ